MCFCKQKPLGKGAESPLHPPERRGKRVFPQIGTVNYRYSYRSYYRFVRQSTREFPGLVRQSTRECDDKVPVDNFPTPQAYARQKAALARVVGCSTESGPGDRPQSGRPGTG